jgi:hypothetical protein
MPRSASALPDAAEARVWLRGGGWPLFDSWIAEHRDDPDPDEAQLETGDITTTRETTS